MPTSNQYAARHHDHDEPCLPTAARGDEPMRRRDYKANKHGKPMPVRYKRVQLVADPELVLIELSRMQRAGGAL